jgi:hypothetical protein
MNEMKYLRPRLPEKEIELCLDLFDKEEAKKRILDYITGVFDDAESQLKNCFIHDVVGRSEQLKAFVDEFIEAWEDGNGSDSDLYRKAKSL